MRGVRLAVSGLFVSGALLVASAHAFAQTTTVPPVPPIPVTGDTTTTTSATATTTDVGGESGDLASTGVAADMLVPAGFVLIGAGAVLQAAARRRPRNAYGLL